MSDQEPKLHEILSYLCDKESVLTFKERILATIWLIVAIAILSSSLCLLHNAYIEWAYNLTRTSYTAYSEFWATIFGRESYDMGKYALKIAFYISTNASVILCLTYIRLVVPNILKLKSSAR